MGGSRDSAKRRPQGAKRSRGSGYGEHPQRGGRRFAEINRRAEASHSV